MPKIYRCASSNRNCLCSQVIVMRLTRCAARSSLIWAMAKNAGSISMPTKRRPSKRAASPTAPLPMIWMYPSIFRRPLYRRTVNDGTFIPLSDKPFSEYINVLGGRFPRKIKGTHPQSRSFIPYQDMPRSFGSPRLTGAEDQHGRTEATAKP